MSSPQEDLAPAAPLDGRPLGLLEVQDRNGATVARLPVTRWPVTVGRSLACDLVLDDAHVAAHHLQIDRPTGARVSARVLDTVNGVTYGQKHRPAWAEFDWTPEQEIRLGRLRLCLRLADAPLAPEQALPSFSLRNAMVTVGLMGLLLVWQLTLMWFNLPDADKFAQALPVAMAGMAGVLAIWCSLWALASKLFSGHPQFWRHVRITCATTLAEGLTSGTAHLLAFMFSWENLARFDFLISAPVLATGIYLQLTVIAPQHRRTLRLTMASILLFAVAAVLGSNWLQTGRLSTQRQLASLFPPALRVAPTVPVAQFIDDAKTLQQKLDERLKNEQSSDGAEEESHRDE